MTAAMSEAIRREKKAANKKWGMALAGIVIGIAILRLRKDDEN